MLVEEGKEMFKKYRKLAEYIEEKKDSEGLKLFTEVLMSSSKLFTGLIDYNNRMVQYCNEITEAVKDD